MCTNATGIASNVALAGEDHEALARRLKDCKHVWQGMGAQAVRSVAACEELIRAHARVSINIQPESLLNLLQDPRICWLNLNDNLRAGALMTYPPELAAKRLGIEKIVFGPDGDHLIYGALNLGSLGLYSYGACCVYLNAPAIEAQVSFLEENSFTYLMQNGPAISLAVPAGARALWSSVHTLAIVKHYRDLAASSGWTVQKLAGLLLSSNGDKKTDRFIEAQVQQPITSAAITEVLFSPKQYRPIKTRGIVGRAAKLSRRIADHLVAARGNIKVRIVDQ